MALHAIKNVEPRFPTERLHDQTGIKWLDVERMERCSVEAFKAIHNMSSKYVNDMFPITQSHRNSRTSSVVTFKLPVNKTKFGDNNLPNRCDVYWQSLPDPVKCIDKLSTFKTALKSGNYFMHR